MHPDTMRAIDAWAGPPLCAALELLDRVRPGGGREQAGGPVRRVLFVKLAEIGAMVLLYPALCRARELWPEAELHLLTFPEGAEAAALLGVPPPEHVHVIPAHSASGLLAGALRCARRLRRLRFDVAVDLEFFSRAAALLCRASGARVRVGYHRFTMEGLYKGRPYTRPVPYNPQLHAAAGWVWLVETAAAAPGADPWAKVPAPDPASLPIARFRAAEAERREMLARLRSRAGDGAIGPQTRLVVLNPNTSDLVPLRRWPAQRFVELGRRLLEEPDVTVVLTGRREERPTAAEIGRAIGGTRVCNLAGETSLRDLATLFTLAALLVTSDSGPAHLAALAGLPAVVLYGPETPRVFGTLGAERALLSAGLACSPCVNAMNHRRTRCSENRCMQAIAVEDVLGAARGLLRRSCAGGSRPE